MPFSVVALLQGIEARLKTIDGLRVAPYIADQVNPPQAVVGVPEIPSYRVSMQRGTFQLQPEIFLFVSKVLDRPGQMALAAYTDPVGPKSVRAAIEGDRTLGGVVSDCIVTSFRPLGIEEVGLLAHYGGVFSLDVYASGK